MKYNNWEILYILPSNGHGCECICRCDCGRIHKRNLYTIKRGTSTRCPSCRCKKHNMSHTRLYGILSGLKSRCYCKKNTAYHNYGARGITVCKEWLESAQAFIDWALSNGYQDNLTIDRIDVNGDYEPNNCRWADMHFQNANKRPTSRNTSGVVGVNYRKDKKKFEARLKVRGKVVRLGYFKDLESARIARLDYIEKHNLLEYL